AIEHRLKPAMRAGQLESIPQSLPEMEQWTKQAAAKGLVTPEERRALSDFARFTDLSVRVDDFPPDLNAAADADKRWRMAAQEAAVEA
ncbi:MAG TPA: acyl-CoA dehydrogenase domain-containing protein, partial [Duganella sp.]|uniref:acyl-CoA dehydrogenase domain-containing protein n=1 Tax=Duganella sp. TaxID=1904440 RepID=UPI002ECFBCA7